MTPFGHPIFALGLVAVAVSANAASHRLAYSKAENVEVFVDHPDGQPWCSKSPELRFAFADKPSAEAVSRLLPKLGSLMATQCPIADALTWTSRNSAGDISEKGRAAKGEGWTYKPATQKSVTETATPAPPPAPQSQPEQPPLAENDAPNLAAPSPEPDKDQPSQAASSEAAPSPEVAARSEMEAPPVAEPSVKPVQPQPARPAFTVAGWTPPAQEDVFAKADFLTELVDQNGCRFRLSFVPEDGIENVSAQSKGVACGTDGYAQGAGELVINRRDGVRLHQYKGSFVSGLALNGDALALPVIGFDERKNMLLLLHSDGENKIHYVIRLPQGYDKRWSPNGAVLIALTENVELFRNLATIEGVIREATSQLDAKAPDISGIRLYGMRDLEKGLSEGNRDYWLYEISLSRQYRTRKWQYEPQRAENHLFASERRQAEAQRRAEVERERSEQRKRERVGYEAERQLQLYRQLASQAADPQALYRRLINDVTYSPTGGGGYSRLMLGGNQSYSQIVQITGQSGEAWTISYPYQAEVLPEGTQAQLSKGWYLLKGTSSLDLARQDDKGLPMTQVRASSIQRCEEEGCSDLSDPVVLVRHELGDATWTPERAREQIKQAWPERAETQGEVR